MASGEAEPLQYTTTALRVSIHCEGCKKKVKKVLHSIEGVYKVTVDAAQHKVTVTGSVEADALLRRLHKAGKQAALWPSPSPAPAPAPTPAAAVEGKKPEEPAPAALPVPTADSGAKDAKPEEDKPPETGGEGKEKKPAKDSKAADNGDAAANPNKGDDSSKGAEAIAEPKEGNKAASLETAKQDAAEEEEPSGGKKGKKNRKNKHKDGGGEGTELPAPAPAATPEAKKPPQPPLAAPAPSLGPERPHGHGGAFPYYAAQPVVSYNVAHPSSSLSYYAPAAAAPMHPMPPAPAPAPPQMVPYGYPPYPAMVPVPVELVYGYGPPGMRSSPPQESYNNMFNEDNAHSCTIM